MSENLITSGLINPQELPLAEIRQQVAIYLNIPVSKIERLECWKHQSLGQNPRITSEIPQLSMFAVVDCQRH